MTGVLPTGVCFRYDGGGLRVGQSGGHTRPAGGARLVTGGQRHRWTAVHRGPGVLALCRPAYHQWHRVSAVTLRMGLVPPLCWPSVTLRMGLVPPLCWPSVTLRMGLVPPLCWPSLSPYVWG